MIDYVNYWEEANQFADIFDYKEEFDKKNLNYTKIEVGKKLPFKDKEFDYVILSHVLEHVPNDYKALKELYRILKHHGITIITVPGNWGREQIIEYDIPDGNGHYRDYGFNFISVLENIFTVIECIDLYKYNDIYHLPIGLTPQHDWAFLCRKN